jgi:hypothetical protein
MATDGTDFAAYGLPDPRDQYGNRDFVSPSYPSKIDEAYVSTTTTAQRTLLTHQVDHLMVCVYVCGTR